ncbi:MAG: hypothetical protein SVO26_02130 [Chloroflexota bacterium]|nr:hypothetical protein [Chloroflexota bacterium]
MATLVVIARSVSDEAIPTYTYSDGEIATPTARNDREIHEQITSNGPACSFMLTEFLAYRRCASPMALRILTDCQ